MVFQLPDSPLIAAGALGGPAVMLLVTPLRNALTVGAGNTQLSALSIYKQVFSKKPFAGGSTVAIFACPAFLVIGPAFHIYEDLIEKERERYFRSAVNQVVHVDIGKFGSSAGACVLTGVSESLILYGSETKNAQIAYNNSQKAGGALIKNTHIAFKPFGPGIGLHFTRNILAMSGLRLLSDPLHTLVHKGAPNMSDGRQKILSDLIASICMSVLATPVHQAYSYSVTQRVVEGPNAKGSSMTAYYNFLKRQYLTDKGRISGVAARDVSLRVAYGGTIFTIFGMIERSFVANWPRNKSPEL